MHARGAQVDGWTLDAELPDHVALAHRLVAARIDRITTNDALRLAMALEDQVDF